MHAEMDTDDLGTWMLMALVLIFFYDGVGMKVVYWRIKCDKRHKNIRTFTQHPQAFQLQHVIA